METLWLNISSAPLLKERWTKCVFVHNCNCIELRNDYNGIAGSSWFHRESNFHAKALKKYFLCQIKCLNIFMLHFPKENKALCNDSRFFQDYSVFSFSVNSVNFGSINYIIVLILRVAWGCCYPWGRWIGWLYVPGGGGHPPPGNQWWSLVPLGGEQYHSSLRLKGTMTHSPLLESIKTNIFCMNEVGKMLQGK